MAHLTSELLMAIFKNLCASTCIPHAQTSLAWSLAALQQQLCFNIDEYANVR